MAPKTDTTRSRLLNKISTQEAPYTVPTLSRNTSKGPCNPGPWISLYFLRPALFGSLETVRVIDNCN
jgi:hypothetical protein